MASAWLRQDEEAWAGHVIARAGDSRDIHLSIPAGAVRNKLIFDNQWDDGRPSQVLIESIALIENYETDYLTGLAAEERGDTATALNHYKATLRSNPTHVNAIAGLGRLRYLDPSQPVFDEIRRWRPDDAVFEVVIEVRNPLQLQIFLLYLRRS